MALVGYDSSDEDDEVQKQPTTKSPKPDQEATSEVNGDAKEEEAQVKELSAPAKQESKQPEIIGPMRMPEDSASSSFPPLEDAPMDDEDNDGQGPALLPGSPYTATRALLRDLTLPTVPNMDIPPSPPGSPPPGTSKKFEQFLELKKKGTHFNSRIAQSPALQNPGLMDKLLGFVELDQQKDQYRTALPADLWDPGAFPRWAYKEQLRQSQTEQAQVKARTRGAPVEFVAASSGGGGGGSGQTTTTGGLQKSAVEGATNASSMPALHPGKRKTRFDT